MFLKRVFDFTVSLVMLILLLPVLLILAVVIAVDSRGGVFYRQERVTQYGRKFKIFKFRTMVANADQIGTQVTVNNDQRVTRVGKVLRKYRLDGKVIIRQTLKNLDFVRVSPVLSNW